MGKTPADAGPRNNESNRTWRWLNFPFGLCILSRQTGGKSRAMTSRIAIAAATLALTGCGVQEYLDRHPANIRPEPEAVAAALRLPQNMQAMNASANANQSPKPVPSPSAAGSPATPIAPRPSNDVPENHMTATPPTVRTAPSTSPPANTPGEIASSRSFASASPAVSATKPQAQPVQPINRPVIESHSGAAASLSEPASVSSGMAFSSPAAPATTVALPGEPDAKTVGVGSTPLSDDALSSARSPELSPSRVSEMHASGVAQTEDQSPPALGQAQLPSATSAIPNAHCTSVAQVRADDAAAAGQDREIQRVVRDGTYANCVTWQAAHGRHN
jgi:hypothetical protein